MTRGRVLVVDDNPLNAKLTRILLESHGHEVMTAANAVEAIAFVAAFAPELILMDLQLPGIDGFQLTRQFKSDPATAHIAIIALTAYAMKGDEQRAIDAGCDGYLTKPIDESRLMAVLSSHLQR